VPAARAAGTFVMPSATWDPAVRHWTGPQIR
jgi:hypothetical protein